MQTLSSTKTQSWLTWFLMGLLALGFLILFARLIDLQLIRGVYFRNLADGNRIRRVPISAPRGMIIARGGEILATNEEVKKKISFNAVSGFEKTEIIEGVNPDEIISEWMRTYPLKNAFAHIGGYLGEASGDEVNRVEGKCPHKGPRGLGSLVGRSGLEEEYDCILRGVDGEELVEVDSQGRKVRVLGRKPAVPGDDLRTTIDYSLQKKLAEVFGGRTGAIVVSDSQGEILGLYSSPSYNPESFVRKETPEVMRILNDKKLPLFNRAIGGIFHPGSTFKPIVAIAALETGKIDKDFTYIDTGRITIDSIYGDFSYNNWYFTQYGGIEGQIDLVRALARSTDTFFYKVGELTGVEAIDEWARKFNLDRTTGIDLPGEIAGLIPNEGWKLKVKGERWFLGNTYHLAIGQGDVALTPMELNSAISAIANHGVWCKPHLASGEISGNDKFQITNDKCKDLVIKRENLDLVHEGMVEVCSAGGTAYTFFDFKEKTGIDVACKTGTAETLIGGEPHAWFTAFAPLNDPQIIATILVENGGEGSKVAGPIAREIFDFWFLKNNND